MFTPSGMIRIPEVLMKILSAFPRSTTFVSPVKASRLRQRLRASICTTRQNSPIGVPSSRMKPTERKSGRAPRIARSLTVQWAASFPISPPGKKLGFTTYESVLKAVPSPPNEKIAPSCRARVIHFETAAAQSSPSIDGSAFPRSRARAHLAVIRDRIGQTAVSSGSKVAQASSLPGTSSKLEACSTSEHVFRPATI